MTIQALRLLLLLPGPFAIPAAGMFRAQDYNLREGAANLGLQQRHLLCNTAILTNRHAKFRDVLAEGSRHCRRLAAMVPEASSFSILSNAQSKLHVSIQAYRTAGNGAQCWYLEQ
jgi:hypothetical protein